jgi:hypothetical protein
MEIEPPRIAGPVPRPNVRIRAALRLDTRRRILVDTPARLFAR